MTLSTSLVAVWYSSDSWRSPVRSFSSLNSRTFSIAITAWSAKVLHQLDLSLGERLDPISAEGNRADEFAFAQ